MVEQTFDSIAENGRAVVTAHRRKQGLEEGFRRLLSDLYPDNAHFIYELLQNAEDARATVVEFELDNNALEVRHNGTRAFTLKDIDSITNIGASTKKDDPTQIGKFGVGFKAVYSYTARPEVRSGEYAFAIEELFINKRIDGLAPDGWTSFRLPFDRDDKPALTAVDEIERGLTELDEKTLLFLQNISTITYVLPDGRIGIIERECHDDLLISVKKSENDVFIESHWLRLTGPARVDHDGENTLTVAAAFRMELAIGPKEKRGKRSGAVGTPSDPKLSIVPLEEGDVSIYFPAVKESSGLRFHIHAPFASTVARDSVRDDPGNARLVEDIASLIAGALPSLCSRGLVTDSFLETLPNHDDQIGQPYSRIRDAVTEAFNAQEITPAWGSGGYAPARNLVASPSEFRRGLEPSDLSVLLELAGIEGGDTPRWIRDRDGRAGKFLAGLDTIEFGWEELGTVTSTAEYADEKLAGTAEEYDEDDNAAAKLWFSWLDAKKDDALLRFYLLIGFGFSNYELLSELTDVPIVRLRKRNSTVHVRGAETYLPSGRSDTVQARIPIDLAYFDDDEEQNRANNLRAFYTAAGVKRWDETAKLEQRLAAYQVDDRPIPGSGDLERHLAEVRSFVLQGLSNRTTARASFQSVRFLLAPQSDGSWRWVSPNQTFIDLPYRDTGLSALYPRTKRFWKDGGGFAYDQEPYPLAGFYLDVERIDEFLEIAGSRASIEISKADVTKNQQFKKLWRWQNRENSHGLQIDWDIKHLNAILEVGDPALLKTLWHTVLTAPAARATAIYRANASSERYPIDSQLAQSLKSRAWVLSRDGDLNLPRNMTVEDLPEEWQPPTASSLVYKLDFGVEAMKRRQKEEGVSDFLREEGLEEDGVAFLREAKEGQVTVAELREFVRGRAASRRFPEGASVDSDRRAGVAAMGAISAPQHSTQVRPRSVVDGRTQASAESKAYLRQQYTSVDGEMFCQACRNPLPFKTHDGTWYFEAVRFVTARKQVHTSNAVALCPLCAALYKYARETKNETLLGKLANTSVESGQGLVDVPVVLNGKRVKIGFTGKHAIDIRTALCVAGSERTPMLKS